MLFALWLVTAAAADAGTTGPSTLSELLARAGENEALKASATCAFIEESIVEQLDSDGRVEGKVIRRAETTVKQSRIVSRKVTSKKVEGDPSSMIQKDEEPKGEARYSAFHPNEQRLYRFELLGPADADTVKVRFAPLEKDEKKMQGTAWIDRRTGLVTHIDATPSDLPMVLDEMTLSLDQEETPCGPQVTHLRMSGKAGLLFFKKRFRADTKLSGHHVP
ncbi:MAG: hypothetical protein IRZ16_03240 [Myxococcaceae bacterium]|nr:hypothetical protein [Myxococcaceae bacterium]